jgi:hypothetical protein
MTMRFAGSVVGYLMGRALRIAARGAASCEAIVKGWLGGVWKGGHSSGNSLSRRYRKDASTFIKIR